MKHLANEGYYKDCSLQSWVYKTNGISEANGYFFKKSDYTDKPLSYDKSVKSDTQIHQILEATAETWQREWLPENSTCS